MSKIQKTFITFGVFWLSVWVAAAVGWPLSKLTNGMSYTDTIFNAFALGFMNSLGRTLAAILAGVLVTTVVSGRKSQFWAFIVAALYLVDAPVRFRWVYPATAWDQLWQGVSLVIPAVACLVAAFVTAKVHQEERPAALEGFRE